MTGGGGWGAKKGLVLGLVFVGHHKTLPEKVYNRRVMGWGKMKKKKGHRPQADGGVLNVLSSEGGGRGSPTGGVLKFIK